MNQSEQNIKKYESNSIEEVDLFFYILNLFIENVLNIIINVLDY